MFVLPKRPAPLPPTVERIGLSSKEAAQSLGISDHSLFQLTKDGTIPVRRVGRKLVYSVEALRRFANGDTQAE